MKMPQPIQMSDTERLAQLMQGNFTGQLDTSDKLAALSALLRSVGRGSQISPQQALQQFQQQKMQEGQGRIQMDQLRKQAEQQAQLNAVRQQYISELSQTNPQLARAVQLMSADDFAKLIVEQNKPQGPTRLAFDQGIARNPYTGAVVNPKAAALNLPTIYGDDDPNYDKLPSGAQYVDAEGFIKVKS